MDVSGWFDESKLDLKLYRPHEPRHEPTSFRALPAAGRFHLDGTDLDVRTGDYIAEPMPSGPPKYHRVTRVTRYPGGELANTDIEIEEVDGLPLTLPGAKRSASAPFTWARDMAVLQAVVTLLEAARVGSAVTVPMIAAETGLSDDEVEHALEALQTPPALVDEVGRGGAGSIWSVRSVTGEGRRKAGAWPDDAHAAAERLIAALGALARDDRAPEDTRATAAALYEMFDRNVHLGVDVMSRVVSNALAVEWAPR